MSESRLFDYVPATDKQFIQKHQLEDQLSKYIKETGLPLEKIEVVEDQFDCIFQWSFKPKEEK